MNRKYLAFDIETAKVLPEATDWKSDRPLGITCAATFSAEFNNAVVWRGKDTMSQQEVRRLVHYLTRKVAQGYTLLTWNGLSFDLDILAEESGMSTECKQLAVNQVDMMYHILCKMGYGVSLDAAARGMNLTPKTLNGADAPKLWAEGKRHQVLEYVAQDARTTMEVALKCESSGRFQWIAKSGNLRTMHLPDGWLTVEEAEQLPVPNTWWMADPWKRADFTEWLR